MQAVLGLLLGTLLHEIRKWGLGDLSVGTMAAAIGAARTPLEMIMGGEDHVATIVEIGVLPVRDEPLRLCENGPGIVQLARQAGNRLQTGPAKTSGLDAIGGEAAQDVVRDEDLMAPAGALVEMPFRHTALIISATPGTLLVTTQTELLWLRYHRFLVKVLGFQKFAPYGHKNTTYSGIFIDTYH